MLTGLFAGAALLVGFVGYSLRAKNPMLPMRLFRSRAFSGINAASLLMFLGMFGSIFLLSQFMQGVLGYSPTEAGLRMLPWTGMPMLVAPIAGILSDRIGAAPSSPPASSCRPPGSAGWPLWWRPASPTPPSCPG